VTPDVTPDPDALVELVAAALLAHPSVARLHGGRFNDIASYVATGRLLGVRVGEPGEPVEVGVVLRLDRPIPDVVDALRATVSALCGGRPVDVTVGDVVTGEDGAVDEAASPDPADPSGLGVATPFEGPDAGRMVR
jgi:hypothetical protein